MALQDLVTGAEARLRQLDRAVEQSLLSGLSAATSGIVRKEPGADPVEVGPLGDTEDDALLSKALALVIATDTGCIVTSAQDLSAGLPLLLQFPDGAVPVRVEPFSSTTHCHHSRTPIPCHIPPRPRASWPRSSASNR
jgi:exodeoxyribonuclease VII large subunit